MLPQFRADLEDLIRKHSLDRETNGLFNVYSLTDIICQLIDRLLFNTSNNINNYMNPIMPIGKYSTETILLDSIPIEIERLMYKLLNGERYTAHDLNIVADYSRRYPSVFTAWCVHNKINSRLPETLRVLKETNLEPPEAYITHNE